MPTPDHEHLLTDQVSTARSTASARRWLPLVAATGFVLLYLATDVVASAIASAPLPLPDDPAEVARAWFADNQLAAVMIGLVQSLSVACLGIYVIALGVAARTARPWGLVAMGLMMLASALMWILAALAPDAGPGTVSVLRTANFVSGGTAHVLALGIFVLLASKIPGFGKGIRRLAYVAAVPALLSVVSLVWFQGAVFILLGRLLCMVWTISAGVAIARRRYRNT